MNVDSSGNVYVSGYIGGTTKIFLSKYNSSITHQWTVNINSGTEASPYIGRIDFDSSDNVYIFGTMNNPSYAFYYAKINSSGTMQWSKKEAIDSNIFAWNPTPMVIDRTNGFMYVGTNQAAGFDSGTGSYQPSATINKISLTDGSLIWSRGINPLNTTGTPVQGYQAVFLDPSGNIYGSAATGNGDTPAEAYTLLTKYNSSGTLQWQRRILLTRDGSTRKFSTWYGTSDGTSIFLSSRNSEPVISNNWITVALPADGSKTGTYSITPTYGGVTHVIAYSASSYATLTPTPTLSNSHTLGGTAASLTVTTSTMTEGAGTLTPYKTTL